jgi:endonuclease/exonuclease/phosphatase family metal-dependent hydrolase
MGELLLKLFDLNIALYNDWEERKPRILELIREQKPDIVTLQEVMDDAKYNRYGDNQAKELAKELGFKHCAFYLSGNLQKESSQWFGDRRCRAGEAILSRYPLRNVAKKRLKRQPTDKHYRGIVYAEVKVAGVWRSVIVVHFSNDNILSLLHMKEVLAYAKKKNIYPVIVGDFNIKNTNDILALTPKDFTLSYAIKKYVSYPSKGETLDYIMLPKGLGFRSLECLGNNLSDHKALVACIE